MWDPPHNVHGGSHLPSICQWMVSVTKCGTTSVRMGIGGRYLAWEHKCGTSVGCKTSVPLSGNQASLLEPNTRYQI